MGFLKPELKRGAKLCLFLSSYAPLFLILSLRQVYTYRKFLSWGGLDAEAVLTFIKIFGFVSALAISALAGFIGVCILLENMHARTSVNGDPARIEDIENKNSESISYLFTYLIPFVFQDLSDPSSVACILILLIVTFAIYTNSSMLLVNPTISIWYSLYEIKYIDEGTSQAKKGLIICRDKFLDEHDRVKLKRMGHRLYYAVAINCEA